MLMFTTLVCYGQHIVFAAHECWRLGVAVCFHIPEFDTFMHALLKAIASTPSAPLEALHKC